MPDNRIQLTLEAFNKTKEAFNELEKSMKDLNTGTRSTLGSLKGIFADLKSHWLALTAATAGFSVAVYKVKDYIVDVTRMAGKYEMLGISMRVAGQNAGYSSQQMDEFEKKLRETGIAAIESRQTLSRMAASNIDLAESSKIARAAQDLAVVGGINSSEAFERLIYAIQSAQVEMVRTIGLNVSFEDGYKKLAKQLGKNTTELTEYEKIQSRVNTVIEAAAQYQGIYEKSMSSAEKQNLSLKRVIDDYKVAFGEAFQPAYLKMVQAKTEAYKNLKETVSDPEFQDNLKALADIFATIYTWGSKIPSAINPVITKLRETATLGHDLFSPLPAWDRWKETWQELTQAAPITPIPGSKLPHELWSEEEKKKWIKVYEDAKKISTEIKKLNKDKPGDSGGGKKGKDEKDVLGKAFDDAWKDAEAGLRKLADAYRWYTDQSQSLTLSDYDYKRAKLLEEYEDRAKVLGWTEQLYQNLKLALGKIDDDEVENKKKTLSQIHDLEISHQLAIIDLKEKSFELTKGEANKQRIMFYEKELESLNQQHKETLGIADKDLERLLINQKIDEVNNKIVASLRLKKELSGTLTEGMKDGWRDFINNLKTNWQDGFELVQTSLNSLQSTISDISFDAMKGKMKDWRDYVNMLLDSIRKKLADMISQWLLFGEAGPGNKGIGGLMGFFSSLFGGMGNEVCALPIGTIAQYEVHQGGYIPRFHFGGLSSDEIPAILQRGEYVVSRKGVDALDRINRGEKESKGDPRPITIINKFEINATDADSFRGQLWKVKQDVAAIMMSVIPDNHPIRRMR